MNTTYILNRKELSEKLQGLLRWFDLDVKEKEHVVLDPIGEQHIETRWTTEISFRGMLLGYLNCIHSVGRRDKWTVMKVNDPFITDFSSHSTHDLDEAIEFIMKKS